MIFLPKRWLVLLCMGDRGYFVEASNDAIEVKKKLSQVCIGRCSSFDTIARTEYSLKLLLSIFNLLNEY